MQQPIMKCIYSSDQLKEQNDLMDYVDYLKTQLTRTQAALDTSNEENKLMREALEYYGDKEVYELGSGKSTFDNYGGDINETETVAVLEDNGELARQTLSTIKTGVK